MNGKNIEIGGKVFDLTNPEEKKAAIRAWLKAKATQKTQNGEAASPKDAPSPQPDHDEDPPAPRG